MKFGVQVRLNNNFSTLLDKSLLQELLKPFYYGTVVGKNTEEQEDSDPGVNAGVIAIIVACMIGVVFLFCVGWQVMRHRDTSHSR